MNNGPWVLESIQTRLDEWCPKLFGYHMLKLGGLSCELTSCNCNTFTQHKQQKLINQWMLMIIYLM